MLANCWNTHRPASLSKATVPSPSLVVWQLPPKPDHKVLVAVGPMIVEPVLEYTANAVFTSSTTWVVPTAPFVSGGAQLHGLPTDATPMPSKLASVGTVALVPMRVCAT